MAFIIDPFSRMADRVGEGILGQVAAIARVVLRVGQHAGMAGWQRRYLRRPVRFSELHHFSFQQSPGCFRQGELVLDGCL